MKSWHIKSSSGSCLTLALCVSLSEQCLNPKVEHLCISYPAWPHGRNLHEVFLERLKIPCPPPCLASSLGRDLSPKWNVVVLQMWNSDPVDARSKIPTDRACLSLSAAGGIGQLVYLFVSLCNGKPFSAGSNFHPHSLGFSIPKVAVKVRTFTWSWVCLCLCVCAHKHGWCVGIWKLAMAGSLSWPCLWCIGQGWCKHLSWEWMMEEK